MDGSFNSCYRNLIPPWVHSNRWRLVIFKHENGCRALEPVWLAHLKQAIFACLC